MNRIAIALCAALLATASHAQQFPIAGKPIRFIVPFPPGGQTDIQARAIAQKVSESLGGHAVIVENKAGGSTVIGAREVQKSPPDGHTLLYTIATHVQIPHLYKVPPWDPFKDFTPITAGAKSNTILTAHVSMPFNNVKELVEFAKANPGKLNFASFGAGSSSHLNGEKFKRLAEHRHRARAVQGQRRRDEGPSVGRGADLLRRADHRHQQRKIGQGEADCDRVRDALRRAAGPADDARAGLRRRTVGLSLVLGAGRHVARDDRRRVRTACEGDPASRT